MLIILSQFTNFLTDINMNIYIYIYNNTIFDSKQRTRKGMDTILVSKQQKQRLLINSQHPLFYFKSRNYFLQNLTDQIQTKQRIGQIDLKRNVHVDYLSKAYQRKKQIFQKQQKQKLKYLKPETYQTIFDVSKLSKEQKVHQEQLRLENQRMSMYDRFIQNYEQQKQQEKPQIFILNPASKQSNLNIQDQKIIQKRQKDIKLLNRQIDTIRLQIEEDSKKLRNNKGCSNIKIIQKISSSILSSYMAYFDQIFTALIDQILQQQVKYLNSIQEQWGQKNEKSDKLYTANETKLIQVLRELDQLAYDE